ncbi:hypothetical protein HPB50_026869 [Hyalomma asiaticum]|uniref:Uncharacterized protein n=1 Tax=Hyalomma asiaticum TaxID=266040 RepID=A0ACB7TV11_HYAAI|nr:hypothetical protein HPB50_026869 [Hyalomma asiaticum]
MRSSIDTSPSGTLNKKQFSLTGKLNVKAMASGRCRAPRWLKQPSGTGGVSGRLVTCSSRCTLVSAGQPGSAAGAASPRFRSVGCSADGSGRSGGLREHHRLSKVVPDHGVGAVARPGGAGNHSRTRLT